MASQIIELEQGVWTQVTDARTRTGLSSISPADGKVDRCLSGSICRSDRTGLRVKTLHNGDRLRRGQSFPYYGVAAGG